MSATRRGRPPRYPQAPPAPPPAPASIEEPLLKSGEIAARLKVSRRTVQLWAKTGALACVRIGTGKRPVLRFRAADVLQAVVERRGRDLP